MKYSVRKFRKTPGDSKGRGVWRDVGEFNDVSDLSAAEWFFEEFCRTAERLSRLSEGPFDGILRLHDRTGAVIATYAPHPAKLAAAESSARKTFENYLN